MKKKAGFYGGIDIVNRMEKFLTSNKKIIEYAPSQIEISMEQAAGSYCEPIVKEGQAVLEGDLIAIPQSRFSCNLHSGITGIVTKIKINKNKKTAETVVIKKQKGEHKNKERPILPYPAKYNIAKDILLNKIKEAGIIGMGGAGFPTWMKYGHIQSCSMVLLNGMECEAYLTCDDRLMQEYPEKVIRGLEYLTDLAGTNKGIICVEDNKKEAIQKLKLALDKMRLHEKQFKVCEFPVRYPAGSEKQLIYEMTQREIPAGKFPADIGVMVSNVATAAAVTECVEGNQPLMKRIVTVTGKIMSPVNFLVPIGTAISELLELSGKLTTYKNLVISGGAMTGTCIGRYCTENTVKGSIKKTTSGILILEEEKRAESSCIRCGGCERVCPAFLSPYRIENAYYKKNYNQLKKLSALQCISCGCCSYVCPAKRDLAAEITEAKQLLRKRG